MSTCKIVRSSKSVLLCAKFSARAKTSPAQKELREILCTRAILSTHAILYARANLTATPSCIPNIDCLFE